MSPTETQQTTQLKTVDDFTRQGWVLHSEGKQDAAETSFRQAVSIDPKSIEAYYGLGLVLKAEDRRQDAVQAFQQVLSLLEDGVVADPSRHAMLRRLSMGHINQLKEGDWNLEKEIWKKRN
jgi:tetratricopeptide (TPR) repeat protein